MKQVTEEELKQMIAWNENTWSYPKERYIPDLIASQAVVTPDVAALTMGDQVLSYADLNQRANQLAHQLLASGVQPGMLIGLCTERSLDMVVGMLGILKSGGAYVPLDPGYPGERLAFMLHDASIPLLVTQRHLSASLSIPGANFIFLDRDGMCTEELRNDNPGIIIKGEDLAYTIYTSGSTGQPKGVQVTHESLLNLIFWHRHAFAITSSDRATQVSSIAFDATGWELWPYLTAGAQIYLADEITRTSPLRLRDWLVEHRISVTFLPTPIAEEVIQLDWPSSGALRLLLTGADRLRRYPAANLPFALINNYGPTEATVVTTSGHVLPTEYATTFPSIGYPIANTQVYILDEHLQHVPIGGTAELYIGGTGLAKGYLNRPDITEQRFIQHPFSDDPHARLYKTGDLGYYLPDGQIAFVGRNDQQVKIRGFRIELGEIETVLSLHPMVSRAVVLNKEDKAGGKQLVAYIMPRDAFTPVKSDEFIASIRQMVGDRLPDYMIPLAFVLLNEFPLTYNGKIDYSALPEVEAAGLLQDTTSATSQNIVEQRVMEIIMSVLSQERVESDDNFFMLGGHSLLGTQVIARVAEAFGIDLSLRTLFNAPTVRLLSAEIEQLIVTKIEAMSEDEARQLLESRQNS